MPYRDKAKQQHYQKKWLAGRRAEWFRGKKCADCNSTRDLELDHIDPEQKKDHRIWSWSRKRQLAELQKCQVLCHDCHSDKTAAENAERNTIAPPYRMGSRKSHRLWDEEL